MNIELRNLQIFKRMSQETTAFAASIYIDGKKVGTANNGGTGGPTDYSPLGTEYVEILNKADEFCKEMPPRKFDDFSIPMNLEEYIDQLVDEHIEKQETNRLISKMKLKMKTALLWGNDEKYYPFHWEKNKKTVPIQELMSTAGGRSLIKAQIETLKLKYPGMRLLNDNINLECLQEK